MVALAGTIAGFNADGGAFKLPEAHLEILESEGLMTPHRKAAFVSTQGACWACVVFGCLSVPRAFLDAFHVSAGAGDDGEGGGGGGAGGGGGGTVCEAPDGRQRQLMSVSLRWPNHIGIGAPDQTAPHARRV